MSILVNSNNFQLIAAKFYDDIGASDLDFQEDLRRFLLIKRLLNVYLRKGELKHRLILNHLIIIMNVFGDASVNLICHELNEYLPQIIPFLIFLKRLPPIVNNIRMVDITIDEEVVECLRCI